MSIFAADLEARLSKRLAELDDERARVAAALAALAPARRVHKQHVPRGLNRESILNALRTHGGMKLRELRDETGIAAHTLSSTLNAMKRRRRVVRRADGTWKARR